MPRTMLKDEHWTRLKPILLELNIYDKGNLRQTVEGVLYRMRVGCPWRDQDSLSSRCSWQSDYFYLVRWYNPRC
ncbi:transposase [Psychrobacter sp. KFRI-CH2-11]|uniref:transposase n=1 Tax=Psychrobacter sp. KFRI-CH2-11 TaxID=3156079 RepID=UPI0033130903